MASISTIGTAKVYEFPVGGRKIGGRRFENAAVVTEFKPKPILVVDFGNWYHEEALREAETAPKS